ncbi:hypothetical protein JQC92_08360 [Shewanella sp. 202IG2-18]|uniref:capsule assembly Wzi family protein n=1 Tax=Parashewanella hymeniacidonis TaxID=2807618 RepID=UPI001960801D|nr:capsule assembly Wzi family protein [Parashewanella hymeniacidonis]MBM7072041.1 hypothetical protein [Parashewanella hymeniacidonis]
MRKSLLFLLGTLACSSLHAASVSPYIPLKSDPLLENDIETLAIVANIPKVIKPYNVNVILDALPKIKHGYPELYFRLYRSLRPYKSQFAITHSTVSVFDSGDTAHPIPNARGATTDNRYLLSSRAQWQVTDWLGVYLGTELSQQHKQATGSMLSLGFNWAQLDVGYRDHWYSPFTGHSQIMSTNAKTFPSVTLSNNLPITFLDTNLNYEFFLAQTDRQPVLFNGQWSDKNKPLLAGFHFSFEPIDGWTLGVNRVFQFGGGERKVSFKTLVKAFVDPGGADNTREDLTSDQEAGNQVASITSKMNFDAPIPFSVIAELAGEDTSNSKNYQFGNPVLAFGLHFPMLFDDKVSFGYEYSYWTSGWYQHHLYRDGFVNDKFVLGHWALQQQREQGTALEGESHYLRTQYRFDNNHNLITQIRLINQKETAKKKYKNSWEIETEYVMPWQDNLVSVGAYLGEDILGKNFWQARFSFKWI